MDMHVAQRFHGHRALRQGRMPLPDQACAVMVATRGMQPWFSSFHVACEAVRAFRQPAALGDAALLAWVLLPDRACWLLLPGGEDTLAASVSRMKATAATRVNRMLARAGPLWEPSFDWRMPPDGDESPRVVARQFVALALRDGQVEDFGRYPFWDCAWM